MRERIKIENSIPLVETILGERERELGRDYLGYRNHVYRMLHFCFALSDPSAEQREKIVIAGCFHDLGIWTADTFDYLPPSIELANEYLKRNDLEHWSREITLMIDLHHRVRKYCDDEQPLVEPFRQGDLVDFSLGLFKCGLSGADVRAVKAQFPNSGFPEQLVRRAGKWFLGHPLNPVPVLRW